MSLRKRGLLAGAVVMSGALALSACSSSSNGGGGGAAGGTFSMAIEAPQAGLTPTNCYDLYCYQVNTALYTGLFVFTTDDNGAMVPANSELTKSVTPSNDNKKYTIELNPGFTFTNGEPVTAQRFVDTFNYAANAGNGQQLGFIFGPSQLNVAGFDKLQGETSTDGKMSGLKAVSDTTLEIDLLTAMPLELFMNFIAGPQVFPMPEAAFKDLKAYNKAPIGNGPYKLKDGWDNATGGTLVKNAEYKGAAGKADTIEMKVYASNDAMWADLQGNTLDVTANMPANALATAGAVLGDRFINQPGGLQFTYYGFDVNDPTYKDQRVRIAVARSIDTAQINEKLYYNTRQAGTSFAPSTIAGGGTDLCGENCVFDPAAAKDLLKQAGGFKGKVHVTQLANETGEVQKAMCNQIQSNLGVECVVDIYKDFGTLAQAQEDNEVPDGTLVGSGWIADNPTIHNMVTANFTCGSFNNYTGYCNKEVDTLLQEGISAATEDEQIAKWQEAESIILKDFWAWPFQMRNTVGGYSTRVSDVAISPGGTVDLTKVGVTS